MSEKHICIICNKEKQEREIMSIRLNEDDGFCKSSHSEDICCECNEKNSKMTEEGVFLTINNKLYYGDGWSAFTQITSKKDIDYIFNREYYDVLDLFQKCYNRR